MHLHAVGMCKLNEIAYFKIARRRVRRNKKTFIRTESVGVTSYFLHAAVVKHPLILCVVANEHHQL